MKNYFISTNSKDVLMQYSGLFQNGQVYIPLNNTIRKVAKVFTIINLDKNRICKKLFNKHFEKAIKKLVIDGGEKKCFIIYGRIIESYGYMILDYLRENYKGDYIVGYYGDLISRHRVDIEKIKTSLDKIFTFDQSDAKKYNIEYCLEPFSYEFIKKAKEKQSEIKWDVTFVGSAKNRYKKIIEIYEILIDKGLKCDFHITDVKKKNQKYKDCIDYSYMEFDRLLEHVATSRCILEIMQDNGYSPTMRWPEAMMMKKNLLTDCNFFKDSEKKDNILYFSNKEDLQEISKENIRKENTFSVEEYVDMFSVDSFVKTINDKLEG